MTAETSCWYGELIGKCFHIYTSVTRRATLAFIGSWVSIVGNNPTLELLNAVLCVLACCYHTMSAMYAGHVISGLFRPFTLKTNTDCGQHRCWWQHREWTETAKIQAVKSTMRWKALKREAAESEDFSLWVHHYVQHLLCTCDHLIHRYKESTASFVLHSQNSNTLYGLKYQILFNGNL